ncbi:unnamed protein product [Durusdinium trenchii]|uniref:Secreted protein n=1 Tax=Durusdinium trenchii TaxID=1381693 RepID=A0ABP0JYU2_9DINO
MRFAMICVLQCVLLALWASADNDVDTVPEIAKAQHMHISYEYQLHRTNMPRQGQGDLWVNLQSAPRVRLWGIAHSPKFGKGTITILLDSGSKTMYARIQLDQLKQDQCLKYPFPARTGEVEQQRLKTLRKRHHDIQTLVHREETSYVTGKATQLLPWTDRYKLGVVQKHNSDKLIGITLRQGDRVVKEVDFIETDAAHDVPSSDEVFQPPESDTVKCLKPQEYKELIGTLDLTPPHQRSSALNDLLLMLSSENPVQEWGFATLLFQSFLLPGDIAVMLENPEPPNIERWHHIAFDYSAVTASHAGHVSRSEGTMWINMEKRAFRLNGNAKNTKVGELHIDLLVHAAEDHPIIYANIVLEDEDEHQCMQFGYPTLTDNPKDQLLAAAKTPLRFFSISEIDGEDCAIFIAPLARERWLHLWVDLESDNPDAFLRSEIHHDGKVLRSTKVLKWRTGDDIPVQVQPRKEWQCTPGGEEVSRFAALDIRSMHHKSIQLEDALYSLHELNRDFTVRELLGLTGDLAIVVKVPLPPTLSMAGSVTFDYVMSLDEGDEDVSGNLAIDGQNGRFRLSATDTHGIRVILALDVGKAVAVKIKKPGQREKCLKMNLGDMQDDMLLPTLGAGIFQKVEALGNQECNHFHYSANGGVDSLDLWYSEEENAICQIDLTRSDAKDTVRLQVTTYLDSFMPEVSLFSDFHGDEDQWNCATTSRRPWLHHGEGLLSDSAAPTSETAGAITEALGMLGLLSSQATAVVSSLSWDEALSMRTSSSGMVLKRQDRAPPCCLTDGLQAESGMASPLVRSFDGELKCFGSGEKSEQDWIDQFAELSADPRQEMTGVCLSDGYYRHENAGPGPSTSVDDFVNDDVMSPLLKTFGFTFESTHPLKGYPEGYGGGLKFTGEVWRHRHHGHGEIRVDLEHRRLYLRSETKEFSSGIPEVVSEIIYRGDRNQLWARSLLDNYEQCWQIDTSQALPNQQGAATNPFSRGKLSGHGAVPGSGSRTAQKYTFFIAPEKRVDVFVDEDHTLAYLELTDLNRDVATGVHANSWITAPLSEELFEVGEDWQCEQELPDRYLDQLATWDLIQVFLPQ